MRQKIPPLLSLAAFTASIPVSTFASEIRSANDASFVRDALQVNTLEKKQAQAALKIVGASDARTLARMTLNRNADSEQALRKATHASGLVPPGNQPIEATPPRSVRSYIVQNVKENRTALHLFQKEAQHGSRPVLRAFAQTRLPLIKNQLTVAEREEQRLTGALPTNTPYVLPKPWPSITPIGPPRSTTPAQLEGSR